MTEIPALRHEQLENGLALDFFDRSNRYFGDYHKVRIEVRIRLPLHGGLFRDAADAAAELARAKSRFGAELVEVRNLERMGVPGAEVAAVRSALIEGFLRTGGSYLQRDDYPLRLLRQRLAESAKSPFLSLVRR